MFLIGYGAEVLVVSVVNVHLVSRQYGSILGVRCLTLAQTFESFGSLEIVC